MSKRSRVLVAALTASLLLYGCAPAVEPTPSSTPTLASSPTPEPTQTQETGFTRPASVFGGDCSAVFDEAEVSTFLGSAANLRPPSTEPRDLSPVFTFVEQAGGLECSWASLDGQSGIEVAVGPEGAAAFTETAGCFAVYGEATGCALISTANMTRLSGIVWAQSATETALQAAADSLVAVFEEKAVLAPPVPVPLPADGAWQSPVDCDAIVASVDFDALLGGGPYEGGFGGGNDNYFTPLDQSLRKNTTAYCDVYNGTTGDYLNFGALGGARWNEQTVAAILGATAVSVPGLDVVILRPAYDSYYIEVFQGPNWLQTYSDNPESVYPAMLAIVEFLDSAAN